MSPAWAYTPIARPFVFGGRIDEGALAANRPTFSRSITRTQLWTIFELARDGGINANTLTGMAAITGDAASVRYLSHRTAEALIYVLRGRSWLR